MTREQEQGRHVSASEGVRLGPQAALIKLIGETPNPKDQKLLFSTRAAIAQAIIDAGWRPPEPADGATGALIEEAARGAGPITDSDVESVYPGDAWDGRGPDE